MQAPRSQLSSTIIVVNDEPYCVWGFDLKERNIAFLEGLDVDYFPFLIDTFVSAEDEKRASIALRTAFHHSMETMFSLLGALVQAPDCVYAWLARCPTPTLRSVTERISKGDNALFSKWTEDVVTWDSVAKVVFQRYEPNTEKGEKTKKLYAELWRRLAAEYLNQDHIDEYNSLKHGLRVKAGGFTLKVGIEHEYAVPPPDEEMQTIGHSEFGTTYFKLESIGDVKGNRSLRSRRTSLNWKIERVVLLLQLIAMSIQNAVSALRIANGVAARTAKFLRPSEDSDFEKAWSFSPGVTNFRMDYVLDDQSIPRVSRKELLEALKRRREEG